jgi:CRISPR/Cas system-associated exonuclease Cas4 (RecB family)
MTEHSIYRFLEPTRWATPPTTFSFSSLVAIEGCPLQWQLIHSAYGDVPQFPIRPHPAAVEGEIVHAVLDLLFKRLALAGLPPIGSPEFGIQIARINLHRAVAERVSDYYDRVADHPRGGGLRLRVDTQQLVNSVIRLFRAEYPKATATAETAPQSIPVLVNEALSAEALLSLLSMQGALSELHLSHPTFPFMGVIDLVRLAGDGVTMVDFKTGEPKSVHRQQLMLYAVLWWRWTGQAPVAIEIRYPSHAATFSVSADDLRCAEENLRARIDELTGVLADPPATPRPGDQCRYCDVRQFCDAYWENGLKELPANQAKQNEQKSIDIELTVRGQPAATGFEAQSRSGRSCTVVHSTDGQRIYGPFVEGEWLRILNARLASNWEALELMPWTEVFHR